MSNFKKFLALVLATLMVASMMVFAPAASAYAPTGDYADDIALLSAFGVMLGDGTSYQEKENVTRWQMALLIARVVTGEVGNDMWEADKSDFFTDVNADHYPGAIDFCAEMGYIKGIGDNLFDPEGNITYQDALTMLVRLLGYETETTSYPWGYILTARTIKNVNGELLTADIDTGNKTPLLREEVANLLAKTIYVDIKGADGKATGTTYVESGLKAVDLGRVTLIATATAGINDTAVTNDHRTAKFEISAKAATAIGENDLLDGNVLTVKTANITKNADLHINDYLAFTGSLVWINGVPFVNMHNVTIVDSYGDAFSVQANKDIKYKKAVYDNTLIYNPDTSSAKSVFVEATEGTLSNYGRILICDVDNNGLKAPSSDTRYKDDLANGVKADIARFVPFTRTSAVYGFDMKFTASNNTVKGVNKNDVLTMYYVNEKPGYYEAAVHSTPTTYAADVNPAARLIQIFKNGLVGFYLGNGVTNGIGDTTASNPTALPSFSTKGYAQGSSLNVAVTGDFVSGQVHIGNTVTFGAYKDKDTYNDGTVTFLTVGAAVEQAWGQATLNGTGDNAVVLGDTNLPLGFTKQGAKANSWYYNMADANGAITANLGEKVDYMTVDGKVVYIAAVEDAAATKADPNNKPAIVLVVDTEEDDVVLNDNGTLTVPAFNLATLEYETITIDQFDGKKVGYLINQFGLSVAAGILGSDATELNELVADLIVSNANPYATTVDTLTYGVVAQLNKVEDVYSVGTKDVAKLSKVVLGATAGANAPDSDGTVTLTFKKYSNNALSTNQYVIGAYDAVQAAVAGAPAYDFTGKYLTLNKDSKITVIGADGIKTYTGSVPADGDTILLAEAANAFVLKLSTENIILVNLGANCDDVVAITGATSTTTTTTNGGWYTLSWKTDYVSMSAKTVAGVTYFNYVFDNMFNLDTMKAETVVISTTRYYDDPAIGLFGSKWLSGKGNSTVVDSSKLKTDGTYNGTANQTMYDVYFIGSGLGDGIKASSIYSWAVANEWDVGVVKTIVQPKGNPYVAADANTLVIENATLTPIAGEGYTVDLTGDDTKDVDIVVSYSIALFNQSASSKADEVKTITYADTTGFQGKLLANSNDAYKVGDTTVKPAELVLYKVDDNGVCTIIANYCDQINVEDATIIDKVAK